jgi:prephenate dehydratase
VAYQGHPGAYSEHAALTLCGADARLLPRETLADAFAAVADGTARFAVVPLENTLAGTVPGTVSLLLESGCSVVAEVSEPIDHVLAGLPGAGIEGLREAHSHPVALAQCTRFFTAHPSIRPVAVWDTAGALRAVIESADPARAAVASRFAAERYGAAILAEHLQDHAANFTRFIQAGLVPAPDVTGRGPLRVMLAVRLAHRPGTLATLLLALSEAGANLTRLDSVPLPGSPFEYEFLIEGVVAAALDVDRLLATLDPGTRIRVVGCFDAPRTVDRPRGA